MSKINFVSGNSNKVFETNEIIGDSIILVQKDIDLPELQGEPKEIATKKCMLAYEECDEQPVIIEDTSLCFNAMGGLPGPYIKWYLQKMSLENIYKLLDGFSDKSGYAECYFAYMDRTLDAPILFNGRVNGTIVSPRRHPEHNFGWDPIFEVDGKTFAETTSKIKHKISHRALALEKLKRYLEYNYDPLTFFKL